MAIAGSDEACLEYIPNPNPIRPTPQAVLSTLPINCLRFTIFPFGFSDLFICRMTRTVVVSDSLQSGPPARYKPRRRLPFYALRIFTAHFL